MELSHRKNSREYVQGRARFRRLKRVPGEIDAMHANASSRVLGHTFLRIAGNARFIILPNNCLEQFILHYVSKIKYVEINPETFIIYILMI